MKTTEREVLSIENLKCGGCASTVTKAVEKIDGTSEVVVDLENGTVAFSTDSDRTEDIKSQVIEVLAKAGYPLDGEGNTWQKAKSYISCAKGRLSN